MIAALTLNSSELKSFNIPQGELVTVLFRVHTEGPELVHSQINVLYGLQEIGPLLSNSDWAYIEQLINLNVTYNAGYLLHRLDTRSVNDSV